MHFVVTAWDYRDPDALNRRMATREAHLAAIQQLISDGHFLSGGAITDDEGNMIGSSLHLEFDDQDSLEARLNQDPYIAGKVWETLDIRPLRRVPMPWDSQR